MDLIEIIKSDYQKFPEAQTYRVYAEDVYFKDPVYEFRGLKRYQQMIGFITTWFSSLKLDLHEISQTDDKITTRWTMSWNAPLPWQPRISVDGWSELSINPDHMITSHIDFWHCTKLDVVKQHFRFNQPSNH